MPTILQAFLGRPDDTPAGDAFERRLYVCRRTIEKKADAEFALRDKIFYVCSMSSRTIVYKGMLVATQMRRFFIDLNDAAVKTAVALVHSRYSTNTTPSWERAHPNRFIIHNGEINTLKGNVNWIRAREPNLYSPVLQHDLGARDAHHQPRGFRLRDFGQCTRVFGHERSSAHARRIHAAARAVGP